MLPRRKEEGVAFLVIIYDGEGPLRSGSDPTSLERIRRGCFALPIPEARDHPAGRTTPYENCCAMILEVFLGGKTCCAFDCNTSTLSLERE
jgi:hypothetical protein